MLPVFMISTIFGNYFHTKEYQEIAEILQFHVFDKADSKKFADMHLKYDLGYTHKSLKEIVKNVKDLSNVEDKLRNFVRDFFIEEDDRSNIPYLRIVNLPSFVDRLPQHAKDIYLDIQKKWYTYARRDAYTNPVKFISPKNDQNTTSKNGDLLNNTDEDKNSKIDTSTEDELNEETEKHLKPEDQSNDPDINKIPLPYLYFVPGGRFKESYYWDSHWILIGLLSCNMDDYAFELVQSISYLINKYGYVPNGTRQYYLGRRLTPFFGQMLLRLYNANIHRDWILDEGLISLEKEYEWWMNNRHFDEDLRLNRYRIEKYNIPRPESFKEDYKLKNKHKDIWGAAESGWDFSSRWFENGKDLEKICTGDIIPVDLNVYMLMNERIILLLTDKKLKQAEEKEEARNAESTKMSEQNGRTKHKTNFSKSSHINKDDGLDSEDPINLLRKKVRLFSSYAIEREAAINNVLWSKDKKVWLDYNTNTKTHNKAFYFSNITPLFLNVKVPEGNLYNILDMYKEELFGHPGGIPASNVEPSKDDKGQQWDFPNVWAPLVQMFTEYIKDVEYSLAVHVAKSFFRSVYRGMGANKDFHEKYNCLLVGEKGMGGEYEPQEGFGWTNGTIAWMIKEFGNKLILDDDHKDSYEKVCHIISSKKKED